MLRRIFRSSVRRPRKSSALSSTTIPESSRARTILDSAGLRASKSKGQNFLTQGAIADRIVAAANLSTSDEVVEIGPGLGILSERILPAGVRRLILVELDIALAQRLREKFSDDERV